MIPTLFQCKQLTPLNSVSDGEAQMQLNFGDKVKTSLSAADAKINDGQIHTITLAIRNKAAILGVDGKTIHQFSIQDNVYPVNNLYIGKNKFQFRAAQPSCLS